MHENRVFKELKSRYYNIDKLANMQRSNFILQITLHTSLNNDRKIT